MNTTDLTKHTYHYGVSVQLKIQPGKRCLDMRFGVLVLLLKLTCGVCRNIQEGLQQLHILNVVDINGLFQANQQPL